MKKTLLTIFLGFLVSVFVAGGSSLAYVPDQNTNPSPSSLSLVNPLDYLKNDLIKSAAENQGVGTAVPSLNFNQFLNTKNLSSGDITGSLKAIAVLAINLFLIVIQTIVGILKALLPFLS